MPPAHSDSDSSAGTSDSLAAQRGRFTQGEASGLGGPGHGWPMRVRSRRSRYGRDLTIYALDDYSRTKHVMHNVAR